MPEIHTDLTTPALAFAVKTNLASFFRVLGLLPSSEFYTDAQMIRWHTRIKHPWFNGVLCAHAAPENPAAQIQDAINFFAARNVSVFTWWLAPAVSAVSWEPQLFARGLRRNANTPGMAVDLRALNEGTAAPRELAIKPVEDAATLELFAQIFLRGYGLPAEWLPDLFTLMRGFGFDLPTRSYLAYLDAQPVATATMFLANGVAGIYNVATLPDARGRGIGAAVTRAPLLDARALGYRVGILQSSSQGFPVYQRLGFQQVCVMDHYFWTNAEK
jgi:GNAT superfamily N-acetyltransferase